LKVYLFGSSALVRTTDRGHGVPNAEQCIARNGENASRESGDEAAIRRKQRGKGSYGKF
jgi:hypothetical protein